MMKRVLAVMLATAATMSVGVTALANDVNTLEDAASSSVSSEVSSSEASSSEVSSSEVSSSEVSSSEVSSSEVSSSEASSSEVSSSEVSSSEVSSSEAETPAGEPTGFVFGADEDGIVLGNDILEPGTEYKFPVAMQDKDGKSIVITDAVMKDHKFSYSKISSKGMKRFEIEEYKGKYYLYVEASDSISTKLTDVKYNVKFVKKSGNMSVFTQEVKFQYGYDEANSDYINGLDAGDTVEIDNANPVITTHQFDKIAKLNDYKNVTLAGNGWEFNVNVTDEKTKNLVHSNAGIKEILSKFTDQDFKFFTFSGKPAFAATGRLSLDVDDIVDDFDKMYTYRYIDGKLYRINATFDGDENTLSFRTNRLDNFLVTDKLIKDGTVVTEVDNSTDKDDADGTDSDKQNPSTGAGSMIDAAVLSAIAALSAGTVILKKRSK